MISVGYYLLIRANSVPTVRANDNIYIYIYIFELVIFKYAQRSGDRCLHFKLTVFATLNFGVTRRDCSRIASSAIYA